MPLLELKCSDCGFKTEELVKADGNYPLCPKCGGKMEQIYNGKCYQVSKGSSCSGNCGCCKGCH